MNRMTIDESNAPWNDKIYTVKYKLCINYKHYIFSTNVEESFVIVSGENCTEDKLEELAKIKIYEDHKDLYYSDFCPDYVNIIDICELTLRNVSNKQ